jgi:hypothetical protein
MFGQYNRRRRRRRRRRKQHPRHGFCLAVDTINSAAQFCTS